MARGSPGQLPLQVYVKSAESSARINRKREYVVTPAL
jgi:hypothetical protein